MTSKIVGLIFVTISFIAVTIGYIYMGTVAHEGAHEQIAKMFGCEESKTEINLFGTSWQNCTKYADRSEEFDLGERVLHEANEIVSYNLKYVGILIMLCFLVISILIINMPYKEEEE